MNEHYINIINRMNLDYFEMLGKLRGNESHEESNLYWLSGNINFIYCIGKVEANEIAKRMTTGDIPDTIMFQAGDEQPELFMSTGLFTKETLAVMAHELGDTSLPTFGKELKIAKVSDAAELKAAGAILNSTRGHRIFSLQDYIDMKSNDGQYFYIAEYDGLPVGACMTMDGDDFVHLAWISTLPAYRKLGIAGHVIQAAERDGINRGKKVGARNAYPISINACKRVGYRECGHTTTLTLK
ncbi:MAG: GNAT family N-acetyltransferase [Defluviitaleaceae bacterium]|nr:GNAT family N-acetyltransferase [Defluviitaleaceae bacterium]